MCTNTCAVASDTTDLGVGWEALSFLSSFSRNKRKLKGRGGKVLARLRGRTCYLQAGQGIYSSE